jgi:hypothetical protein
LLRLIGRNGLGVLAQIIVVSLVAFSGLNNLTLGGLARWLALTDRQNISDIFSDVAGACPTIDHDLGALGAANLA